MELRHYDRDNLQEPMHPNPSWETTISERTCLHLEIEAQEESRRELSTSRKQNQHRNLHHKHNNPLPNNTNNQNQHTTQRWYRREEATEPSGRRPTQTTEVMGNVTTFPTFTLAPDTGPEVHTYICISYVIIWGVSMYGANRKSRSATFGFSINELWTNNMSCMHALWLYIF